ncbi:MAG: DUF2304 domain-containing protein [Solirubrobacteraceae bacterium]
MDTRIQLVAGGLTVVLLLVVLELVRRRRLLERYALLWLLSTVVLLVFAVWRGLLDDVARRIGVAYPPNALFVVALFFVLVLLLHFSVAVSRLSDQTKVLAQRMAMLEELMRRSREADGDEEGRRLEVVGTPGEEAVDGRQYP